MYFFIKEENKILWKFQVNRIKIVEVMLHADFKNVIMRKTRLKFCFTIFCE